MAVLFEGTGPAGPLANPTKLSEIDAPTTAAIAITEKIIARILRIQD
jgi:hypothetical protein